MKHYTRLLMGAFALLIGTTLSIAQWIHMDIDSVFVTGFATKGAYQFVATSVFTGVYRSNDNGTTWTQAGLPGRSIQALAVAPDSTGSLNLFAGSYSVNCVRGSGGVFLTTNNGNSWTPAGAGQTYDDVYALTANSSIAESTK